MTEKVITNTLHGTWYEGRKIVGYSIRRTVYNRIFGINFQVGKSVIIDNFLPICTTA